MESGNKKHDFSKFRLQVTRNIARAPITESAYLRWGYRNGKRVSNDETEVKFPLEKLNIRKYICKNSPDKKFSKYDLLAFSYYQDINDKRYYTAIIIKNINGQWYNNDSHASIDQNIFFEGITPYIFIFKRKNC